MSNRLNVTPTQPRGRPQNQLGHGKGRLRGTEEFSSQRGKSNSQCDRIFHALSDPTRRLIFEHLSQGGELTVRELIKHSRVTQQAVAQHLGVLQLAGLVTSYRNGGTTNYYTARSSGGAPLLSWLVEQGILQIDNRTTQRGASNSTAEVPSADTHARAEYVAAISRAIAALKEACDKADAEFLAAPPSAIDALDENDVPSSVAHLGQPTTR